MDDITCQQPTLVNST